MIRIVTKNRLHALRRQLAAKEGEIERLQVDARETFQRILLHLSAIDRLSAQVKTTQTHLDEEIAINNKLDLDLAKTRVDGENYRDQLVNARELLSAARVAAAVAEAERDMVRDEFQRFVIAAAEEGKQARAKNDELLGTIIELRREGFNPPAQITGESNNTPDLPSVVVAALGSMYPTGSDIYRKEAAFARALLGDPANDADVVARMIRGGANLEDISI